VKPHTVIPAALPARTPMTLSSITSERDGAAAMERAAWRKRSGAGFPRATTSAEKTRSPKRGASLVIASENASRSVSLEEATQKGVARLSSTPSIPGIARKDAANASRNALRCLTMKSLGSGRPSARWYCCCTTEKLRPRNFSTTPSRSIG
jgi:hypothetical protein